MVFVRPFSSCTKNFAGAPSLFLRSLEKEAGISRSLSRHAGPENFGRARALFPGYSIKTRRGAMGRKCRIGGQVQQVPWDGTTFAVPSPPMYPRFRNEGTPWVLPKNQSLRKNLSTIS